MRCINITVFRLGVFGEKIDLVPTVDSELCDSSDFRERGRATAFLLPSLTADLKVRAYGKGVEPHSLNLISVYAAAVFLSEVRGILFEELLVDTDEGRFGLTRCGQDGKIRLDFRDKANFGEPVFLETMGVYTKCRIASGCYGRLAVLECESLDSFEPGMLRLAVAAYNGWSGRGKRESVKLPITGALAYRRDKGEIASKLYLAKDDVRGRLAALSALAALLHGARGATLAYKGVDYAVICRHGKIFISSSAELPCKTE